MHPTNIHGPNPWSIIAPPKLPIQPRLPLIVAHAVPQELHAVSLKRHTYPVTSRRLRLVFVRGAFDLFTKCPISKPFLPS